MRHRLFFALAGSVGIVVGLVASLVPSVVLDSKGVTIAPATLVWVREVGVLIAASGLTVFAIRKHPMSPTLRVVCIASAVLHLGLLPIEVAAYLSGVITRFAGIVPNTVLHLVLGSGFALFATQGIPGAQGAMAQR